MRYRLNNQSRVFEAILNKNKIPYLIVGATAFFDREEIKDSIAILKWLVNPTDKIAFERFVNKPPRGLGEKALTSFYQESEKYNYDLLKTLENIELCSLFSHKTKETFLFLKDLS